MLFQVECYLYFMCVFSAIYDILYSSLVLCCMLCGIASVYVLCLQLCCYLNTISAAQMLVILILFFSSMQLYLTSVFFCVSGCAYSRIQYEIIISMLLTSLTIMSLPKILCINFGPEKRMDDHHYFLHCFYVCIKFSIK